MTAIFWLVSFVVAVVLFLYTRKRDLVSKYPESWLYRMFDYADSVIERLIRYTVPDCGENETATELKNANCMVVDDLHRYINIEQLVSIRPASSITFSFRSRIPDREIEQIVAKAHNIILVFSVAVSIACLGYIAYMVAVFDKADMKNPLTLDDPRTMVLLAFLGWCLFAMYVFNVLVFARFDRANFFSDFLALQAPMIPAINITREYVWISTPWNDVISRMGPELSFGHEVKAFRHGVFLNTPGARAWVFSYPRFLSGRLLNDEELSELVSRLNSEIAKFR